MLPETSGDIEAEWPADPFDDEPMRYIKKSNGAFLIYSAGPDLKDQRGKAVGILELETEADLIFKYTPSGPGHEHDITEASDDTAENK